MRDRMFDTIAGLLFGTVLGLSLVGFVLVLVRMSHQATTP